jgi:hypothetical protein
MHVSGKSWMTRRFGEPVPTGCGNEYGDKSGFSRVRTDATTIIAYLPRKKNIETALVISNENGRFCIKMLLTLYDEFDIQQLACKGIK